MDNFRFWNLIDGARFSTQAQQAQIARTRQTLSLLTDDELVDFHNTMREISLELFDVLDDNIKYVANCLGGRAPSDDGLEYFTYWCISCGRNRYDEIYKNPKVLLGDFGYQWEEFGGVAIDAYRMKHPDTDMDLYDFMDTKTAHLVTELNGMIVEPSLSTTTTVKETRFEVYHTNISIVAKTSNNDGEIKQEIKIIHPYDAFISPINVLSDMTISADKLQNLINTLNFAKLQLKKDFESSKEVE